MLSQCKENLSSREGMNQEGEFMRIRLGKDLSDYTMAELLEAVDIFIKKHEQAKEHQPEDHRIYSILKSYKRFRKEF